MNKKIIQHYIYHFTIGQSEVLEDLFKKYRYYIFALLTIVILSLVSEFLPMTFKDKKEEQAQGSLDTLLPKGFVLMPIAITNGGDIMNIIGNHGVVDLYSYSENTNLPEKQVAQAVKILPPQTEEAKFMILVPQKEASYLFEYPDPFYAVIQNPNTLGAKIYKKRKPQSLIVIEEKF